MRTPLLFQFSIGFVMGFVMMGSGATAWARVFDIKNETFASYFKGTYGPSKVQKTAFENSSGAGVSFDKSADSSFSGEFGFLWVKSYMLIRLGAEVIRTRSLDDIKGTASDGTELYKLKSDVNVFNPKIGVEFSFFRSSVARAFFGGSVGQASVTLQNAYTFTAAGTSAFGLEDYTEAGSQTVFSAEGILGFECFFTDTTTFVFEGGYRSLKATSLARKANITTFDGAQTAGSPLKNTDGADRSLELSGIFLGLAFRFYL